MSDKDRRLEEASELVKKIGAIPDDQFEQAGQILRDLGWSDSKVTDTLISCVKNGQDLVPMAEKIKKLSAVVKAGLR